ncbi:SDR family oxidoreductase [Amorphus coralli]|uniref:SDR family oxidoreductase n=1 Tax=Amorphus coralli TaxID=340680 RepID=UPI000380CDD4|nr:SDR family oxidoreductase [Amorphus coralli]
MADGVLIVTGGSRGIGAATSRLAAASGYAVVINYASDAATAGSLVSEIVAAGGRAAAVQADIGVEADVVRLFEEADQLGPLRGLVNNAGIVDLAARVDAMSFDRLRRMFDVNALGPIVCSREAVRRMSTGSGGQGGAIVNVSSASAKLGSPGKYVDYAAAKAAVEGFTVGLALEVIGEGIRVNGVRPGIIDTDIHASGGDPDRVVRVAGQLPMKRVGLPEEVAQAILWLLSDASSYTTGAILDVSGGRAVAP